MYVCMLELQAYPKHVCMFVRLTGPSEHVCMYVCMLEAPAEHVCMYVSGNHVCMFETLIRDCMLEGIPEHVYVCMAENTSR